jgi:lycopene cyclase domain-containing protein
VSYTGLTGLGLLLAAAVDTLVLRTFLLRRKAFWAAYAILLVFQLIVNGVLTGLRVVRYNRSDILGPRIVHAPIEDLGFGFALILLTLSCWVYLGRRSAR